MLVPITLACLLSAASVQNLPPALIVAVLNVEGGTVGRVSRNKNGSFDMGPMQVNSVWLPALAQAHFRGDAEAALARLRDDGCYNLHVGAWILRRNIDGAGGDVAEGVGRYHSRTEVHKRRYQAKIGASLRKLWAAIGAGN